jgi:hypothetical protein
VNNTRCATKEDAQGREARVAWRDLVPEDTEHNERPSLKGRGVPRASSTGGPGARNVDMTDWRQKMLVHRIKFDDDAKQVFLEAFARFGRVMQAAQAAGVSYNTVYKHIENDPGFKEAFEEARQIYKDHIREAVYELAINGVDEPIIGGEFKDEIVGYKKIMFPNLLAMEAKRVDPDYRENAGTVQVNVQTGVVLLPPAPASEEDYISQLEQARLNPPSEEKWRASIDARPVEAEVVSTTPPAPDPETAGG